LLLEDERIPPIKVPKPLHVAIMAKDRASDLDGHNIEAVCHAPA
jgi:hypothetical protein